MDEDRNRQLAQWAVEGLSSVNIPGNQARTLLEVQEFLLKIAKGELIVSEAEVLSDNEGG